MSRKYYLTNSFRDIMYDNMWQFMNLDVIQSMFPGIPTSTILGIDNDNFKKINKNTICFNEPLVADESGHYVFVDSKLKAHSTYEDNILLRDEDDGICHGAAMIYACYYYKIIPFTLISNPSTIDEYKYNYKMILTFYIFIIESGLWKKAMDENFYNENKNGNHIKKSLKTLKNYIKRYS